MSKKRHMSKKKISNNSQQAVRLSQCMIVKNEEKNIEKALSWARGVAFEQIVVDTGSTDRTVEIARQMGAKIFHFDWIDDFSAAKNYAIEQASGDWIAFLDADEYIEPSGVNKLMNWLFKVRDNRDVSMLSTSMAQLDDSGKVFALYPHCRIFRNVKEIRYIGRIHEKLTVFGINARVDDVVIMHTGYAVSAYKETGKSARNIELLRKELARDPGNITIKAYLADSLKDKLSVDNPGGSVNDPEVDALFDEVVRSDEDIHKTLKKKAYLHFAIRYVMESGNPDMLSRCNELCCKALDDFPDDLDFGYIRAAALNSMGQYAEAWELLKKCEVKFNALTDFSESIYVSVKPALLYEQLLTAAQGTRNIDGVVNYAAVLLAMDKSRQNVLDLFIRTLLSNKTPDADVLKLLSGVYNIDDPTDLMFIARTAKNCSAVDFAKYIMSIIEKKIR